MRAQLAAMNLFQVDLDKSWNCLWYCYVRAPVPPLPSLSKGMGSVPVMHPRSRVPDYKKEVENKTLLKQMVAEDK